MGQKSSEIEEKIIQATIDCIEKYGLEGTTNRRIAEKAGVNGAAINYYFRSKEALIKKCMQVTLNNAFDVSDIQRLPEGTPQERYSFILDHLIEGGCTYPGLTRAHFHDFFSKGEFNPLVNKKLNEYISAIIVDLKENHIQMDEEELRLAVVQSFAATFFVALAPRLYKKSLGLDFLNKVTRRRFIHSMVDKLLSSK